MIENARLYERLGLLDTIPSQIKNNGTVGTTYVDVSKTGRVLGIANIGATDITLDVIIQKATSSTGAGVVTALAATQIAATGDNVFILLDLDTSKLGDYKYVRGLITVGNGTIGANLGMELLGADMRYGQAKDQNVTNATVFTL